MLSKLFNSARNIFNTASQTNTTEEASNQSANTEMVTTRGQTGKQTSQGETGGELVETPRSSRKRSRKIREEDELEVADQEAVTPPKKQKVLPLREKDEDGPNKHMRVVVEITVSSIPAVLENVKGDRQDEVSEAESQSEELGEATEPLGVEISDSESEDGSEVLEEHATSSPELPKTSAKSTISPRKVSGTTLIAAQPKHKRFGSEEPELEPEFFSTAAEVIESDKESCDDEAPELVRAQDALESAQSKARDAAKAVEEQETANRKKRQDRNAVLKKQAETANKKRKRAEEAERKAQKDANPDEEGRARGTEPESERLHPAETTIAPLPPFNRSNLPDLLPDEYLQDESESDELMDLEVEVERKRPKKMRFSDLVENKPKDRRTGSTTYRVSEVRSKNLAPKSSFHTKSMKEVWLNGRAGSGVGGTRKVASGGFFKKK